MPICIKCEIEITKTEFEDNEGYCINCNQLEDEDYVYKSFKLFVLFMFSLALFISSLGAIIVIIISNFFTASFYIISPGIFFVLSTISLIICLKKFRIKI